MKYCPNCGKKLTTEGQDFCLGCGKLLKHYKSENQTQEIDNGSFGFAFLSFCFPIVGLILFCLWKNSKPVTAKQAGIGALIGIAIPIAFIILTIVIPVIFAITTNYY